MKEWLKDKFAYYYKRYTWGYGLMGQGVSLFNFVGIWSLVLGSIVRSYVFIPFAMLMAMGLSIGVGWIMFDKLRFKTRFTEQEGIRDDYWYGKLKPNQQMIYTMLLDCIEDKDKVKRYRDLLNGGQLDFSEFKEKGKV